MKNIPYLCSVNNKQTFRDMNEDLDRILTEIHDDFSSMGYCDGDIVSYYTFCETCSNIGIEPEDKYIEGMLSKYDIAIG